MYINQNYEEPFDNYEEYDETNTHFYDDIF